jgi:hypothetical protein
MQGDIIEQKLIESTIDLCRLNIIDFHRCNGLWGNNAAVAMNTIGNWLTKNAVYTIYRCDMRQYPDRSDFPGWNHVGNHQELGQLYWNMFHASFKGTLEFSDMPDFSGTIQFDDLDKPVSLFGDIGRVSASTFGVDVLPHLSTHDLWLSILDEHTHVLLEVTADIGKLLHELIVEQLGIG